MLDLLQQLRDIHVLSSPSWWPLAPGYWILAGLVIATALWLIIHYRRSGVRRAAQREFSELVSAYEQHDNALALATDVSVLLRRTAMTLEARDSVAAITGDQWIEQLEEIAHSDDYTFSSPVRKVLTKEIYKKNGDIPVDQLLKECRSWIKAIPSGRKAA